MKKLYSIGVDIGGTNTDIGLVDSEGLCLEMLRMKTALFMDVNLYVDALINNIHLLISKNNISEITGIGVGVPNGNYYTGCVENAVNLNFKGKIDLKKLIQKSIPVEVIVTNDANAAAYGEMIYGGAKKMKNFIMFTIGTGVGSGIVVDGKLVYGHDGNAGEIGHTIIFPEGRPCNCGRKGCLEQYTSARGIRKTCIEMMKNIDDHTGLEDVISHDYGFKAITKAAMNGNQLANQVLAKTGEILGLALANSVAYTSPEAIFLMGGPLKAGNILLDPIRKSFDENLLSIYKGKTQILVSKLKENEAAILGAAALTNKV